MSEQNIITKELEWKESPLIRFAMWVEYNDKFSDIADHDRCLGYKNTMECGARCVKTGKIIKLSFIKETDSFKFVFEHGDTQVIISGASFDETFETFKKIVEVFCND